MNWLMDARSPTAGCNRHPSIFCRITGEVGIRCLPQLIVGQHVFMTGHSGQAMAWSSVIAR